MKKILYLFIFISYTIFAQPAEEGRIDVNGKLIAPPCTSRFPGTKKIDLGEVNINQLHNDNANEISVPLIFDCQLSAQVNILLSAGMGQADSSVILTDRQYLGLQIRLRDKSDSPGIGLGQPGTWLVENGELVLSLRVKPVALTKLPVAGNFSSTLLMQMTYR